MRLGGASLSKTPHFPFHAERPPEAFARRLAQSFTDCQRFSPQSAFKFSVPLVRLPCNFRSFARKCAKQTPCRKTTAPANCHGTNTGNNPLILNNNSANPHEKCLAPYNPNRLQNPQRNGVETASTGNLLRFERHLRARPVGRHRPDSGPSHQTDNPGAKRQRRGQNRDFWVRRGSCANSRSGKPPRQKAQSGRKARFVT
jgi:hypothetical protein